jgi:hypothetical protein
MLPPVDCGPIHIPGARFWSSLASAINQGQSTQRGSPMRADAECHGQSVPAPARSR